MTDKKALLGYARHIKNIYPESSDYHQVAKVALEALTVESLFTTPPAASAVPDEPRAGISANEIMEIMRREWNEWCDDAGHFPDDFEWKGGNGILSFEPSRWSLRVADGIINRFSPPAASAVPDGWKLVPKMPTIEMVQAAREHHEGDSYLPASLYRAMLAAAPSPEEGE